MWGETAGPCSETVYLVSELNEMRYDASAVCRVMSTDIYQDFFYFWVNFIVERPSCTSITLKHYRSF